MRGRLPSVCVRTLVVSDLHLGSRTGVDVLRRPVALDALLQRVEGADRLVLLGDVLELRHGPLRDAMAAAEPALRAIGERLGDAEVVLVAGNHDHRLVAPWLEARGHDGPPPPLGVDERAGPDATIHTERLARMLAPASLTVAYPGLWLADGVYATHGHYLDRHVTVPSFERLAAGAIARALGTPPGQAATPDDYELVLAPLYAALDALAARRETSHPPGSVPTSASARAWRALSSDGRRPWRGRLMAGAFPLGIGALNAAGIGPVRADLSGEELRRAGLQALRDVVARLGIGARHVVFGHTHRAGPLQEDDSGEWSGLLNSGSWVFEEMYLGRTWGGPYWPGGGVELEDGGPPRHVRLLDHVPRERLRP
jgi:calcineurin-like phosphoesterase family protein